MGHGGISWVFMGVNVIDSKEPVKSGHLEAFVQVAIPPDRAFKIDPKVGW
jgi:hypothetical protein